MFPSNNSCFYTCWKYQLVTLTSCQKKIIAYKYFRKDKENRTKNWTLLTFVHFANINHACKNTLNNTIVLCFFGAQSERVIAILT